MEEGDEGEQSQKISRPYQKKQIVRRSCNETNSVSSEARIQAHGVEIVRVPLPASTSSSLTHE